MERGPSAYIYSLELSIPSIVCDTASKPTKKEKVRVCIGFLDYLGKCLYDKYPPKLSMAMLSHLADGDFGGEGLPHGALVFFLFFPLTLSLPCLFTLALYKIHFPHFSSIYIPNFPGRPNGPSLTPFTNTPMGHLRHGEGLIG